MNRTKIDWWAFRSRGTPDQHLGAFQAVFGGLPYPVRLKPRRGGFLGYRASAHVMVGDVEAGVHAWGGENQRGWSLTSFSGQGCDFVDDWDLAQEAAASCDGYEPRRVDVALDVYDGASSFDHTLAAYRAGGFCPPGAGRPPKCEPMKPEREQDSAIIRIGSREADKYFRGYEKGKQQLGPAVAAAYRRDPSDMAWAEVVSTREHRLVGGEPVMVSLWDWWRMELELKSKTSPLPEDVIDRRDQYFAGAYPYLGEVLSDVDAEALVMRRERGPQLELALRLETLRAQYGSTLFTALTAYGGDVWAVWSKIVGSKHSSELVRAGVLMVDHP